MTLGFYPRCSVAVAPCKSRRLDRVDASCISLAATSYKLPARSFRYVSFPEKGTLHLRCSLVNALVTLRLAFTFFGDIFFSTRLFSTESGFCRSMLFYVVFSSPRKLGFRGPLRQALFACLAFLLLFKPQKANLRFGLFGGGFTDRRVNSVTLGYPRCSVAVAPCKSRRLDQKFGVKRLVLPLFC